MKDKLYIVIPCYNEEEVLPETAKRLSIKMQQLIKDNIISKDSKVTFVNDGSRDRTWEVITSLVNTDNLFEASGMMVGT
ncbi:glycosyltransferase [Lachnospiraceae bacterium 47-T17]